MKASLSQTGGRRSWASLTEKCPKHDQIHLKYEHGILYFEYVWFGLGVSFLELLREALKKKYRTLVFDQTGGGGGGVQTSPLKTKPIFRNV